ncbi:hypothetical protein [Microbacterium sp. 4-7]|uniref:hypothetical protein n=1 Tax=Microbacterium sp. 4-7 TaxID=1885327 RepID=UPI00164F5240|nr:hypothetical protein [Microbacterium sp. 4-7]MBC6496122.1 hypothetical protein [Microbacterium sp. 4-7]
MIEFNLDVALVIQLLVSTVLPLLVGLVTKTVTRPGVRAVLLAAFSLLTSLLVELGAAMTAGTTYDIGQGLLLALPTFLVAVGLHYGLWKPVGAAEKAQELFDPNAIVVPENRDPKLQPVVVNVYAENGDASEIASVVGEKLRRDLI